MSPQHVEIERKYLINSVPENLDQYAHDAIEQGYISFTADGTEVRLRWRGERYYRTVKAGGQLTRDETEIELSQSEFEALWPLTAGRQLQKTRYLVNHVGTLIELDVYAGKLAGLVIAEVEFADVQQSLAFKPPFWFGPEVTEDKRYKNLNLALHGVPE